MKAFTPEISWHNRLPALSLDISPPIDESGESYRIATGGNDCRVYIWSLKTNQTPEIRIKAGLRRHQRSVGAVKFSSEHVLASGDDDGYIYLWKHQADNEPIESNAFLNDDGFEDLETWQQQRVLRGHLEDICDLAWSKDGQFLLSGSVDNSAILWDAHKGTRVWNSDLIKGYVQGVAIDPHNQYLAAISSDRALRIYNFSDKRLLYAVRCMNLKGKFKAFFCDDTVQTFCRRLEFSPDGQFLLAPTSRIIEREPKKIKPETIEKEKEVEIEIEAPPKKEPEVITLTETDDETSRAVLSPKLPEETKEEQPNNEQPPVEPKGEQPDSEQKATEQLLTMNLSNVDHSKEVPSKQEESSAKEDDSSPSSLQSIKKPINVFLVFRRSSLNKPVHYYPTGREVALCARFNPVTYKLKSNEANFWGLPYRLVFAIATSRSVIIYDSQQATPIGYVSQIHLARLTDLAWSNDGRLLMVSSYDGYSTLVIFENNELGELYDGPLLGLPEQEEVVPDAADGSTPPKRGQKRSITPRDNDVAKKEKLSEKESATMWKFVVRRKVDLEKRN